MSDYQDGYNGVATEDPGKMREFTRPVESVAEMWTMRVISGLTVIFFIYYGVVTFGINPFSDNGSVLSVYRNETVVGLVTATIDVIIQRGSTIISLLGISTQVATLTEQVANISLTPGPTGPQGPTGPSGALSINGVTHLPQFSFTVYVTKDGNDTTGTGSELQPFLTIQMALNLTATLSCSTTNRCAIVVAPGRYDEIGDIGIVPWAWIIGIQRTATRVTSSSNLLRLRSTFATGSFRAGFKDILFSGTTVATFDLQALGGSGSTVLEFQNTHINNLLTFKGRTTADFIESWSGQYIGGLLLRCGQFTFFGGLMSGGVLLDDIGCTSVGAGQNGNIASFTAVDVESNIILNRTLDLAFTTQFGHVVTFAPNTLTVQSTNTTLNGNLVVTADSGSVPLAAGRTLIGSTYITMNIKSYNGNVQSKDGLVTLSSLGTATVSDTFIDINTKIFPSVQPGPINTGTIQIASISAGMFTITSYPPGSNVNCSIAFKMSKAA